MINYFLLLNTACCSCFKNLILSKTFFNVTQLFFKLYFQVKNDSKLRVVFTKTAVWNSCVNLVLNQNCCILNLIFPPLAPVPLPPAPPLFLPAPPYAPPRQLVLLLGVQGHPVRVYHDLPARLIAVALHYHLRPRPSESFGFNSFLVYFLKIIPVSFHSK